MSSSLLLLAGWLTVPYLMAAVAHRLEHRSDAQNGPVEGLTDHE